MRERKRVEERTNERKKERKRREGGERDAKTNLLKAAKAWGSWGRQPETKRGQTRATAAAKNQANRAMTCWNRRWCRRHSSYSPSSASRGR